MAFGWPYSLQIWLARRNAARARRRGARAAGADIRVRTPLILALFVAAAYSASWALLLRSSLPVQNPAEVEQQLSCLALNIYHEARGEPDVAQIAVAKVVMNRVNHRRFPGTVCAVVKQGGEWPHHECQFSWWCDGRSDAILDTSAMAKAVALAREVLNGDHDDPTDGAMWYHATWVAPEWRKDFAEGPTIGNHIFYRTP